MAGTPVTADTTPAPMRRALDLAARAVGLSEPNPRVGCVLVAADGRVLGEGHTQARGEAHAEVMALRDAAARGESVAGATAWVTLEPCAHHGRTGPCCDALLAAGVGRVVAAGEDPNPLVAGEGLRRLRAGGVEVQVGPGADEAEALNIGFFHRMRHGLPWVRMKIAASLDGATALANGQSRWITSPAARADGHAWRARAGAVLTGIGTVLEDDPRLDVREAATAKQPRLVVVDSRLQLPRDAALLGVPQRPVLLYGAGDGDGRADALRARGVEVVLLPDAAGKVDLAAMLRDLAAREVNELHVEAGHKLNASLLRGGLVNELLVYLAPVLLGPGRPLAALPPLADLAGGLALSFTEAAMVGPDLRLRARLHIPT